MSVEGGANPEDLLLGSVREEVGENDEVFRARVAAAAAKQAQVRKDEDSVKIYDDELVGIIKHSSFYLVKIVAFFIDHEVPSLTILAIISLIQDHAKKICEQALSEVFKTDPVIEGLDFNNSEIETGISFWLASIAGTDHISNTTRLSRFTVFSDFGVQAMDYLQEICSHYLKKHDPHFSVEHMQEVLNHYQGLIFKNS